MTTATQEQAMSALRQHYDEARRQLAYSGLFGKVLDNKARKLALKLAGITLPEGATIAWATPEGWSDGGYRSSALAEKAAR
jgi:hypothetical protein